MNKFWIIASLTLSALLTSAGILILTVRHQLLQPSLYINAVDESGIYPTVDGIAQDKITDGLITLQKGLLVEIGLFEGSENSDKIYNQILVVVINTIIETQTGKLVENVFTNIQFQDILKSQVDAGVVGSIAWLSGYTEDGEIFEMIPEPEEVLKLQDMSLNTLVSELATSVTGVKELPTCANIDESTENFQRASSGQILSVICTNEQIQPILEAGLERVMPIDKVSELETTVQKSMDALGINKLITMVYEFVLSLSEVKQYLVHIRNAVQLSYSIGVWLIIFGTTFAAIGAYFWKGRRFLSFVGTYFVSGVALLIISLLYYSVIYQFIAYTLPVRTSLLVGTFLTAPQKLALVSSVNRIVVSILKNLMNSTIDAAASLLIATMGLFVLYIIWNTKTVKNWTKQGTDKTVELYDKGKKQVVDTFESK